MFNGYEIKNRIKKQELGQFFTVKEIWLKKQVLDFIKNTGSTVAYDPFAGVGNLLDAAQKIGFTKLKGLDIDKNLPWEINDSLLSIPKIQNSIIITNPPYLAKQSATRKKIDLYKYFKDTSYDDIYLIALDRMLEAADKVVAIVPESFINSNYSKKNYLHSITILEENPFIDTENPVCIVCFDNKYKKFSDIYIYKEDKFINTLDNILKIRINPKHNIDVSFNNLKGWLGLRAVDGTNDKTFINFDFKDNIKYDWNNKIKTSSRHITLIDINIPYNKRENFIKEGNRLINQIRKESSDILLTPFKGNTKNGKRRRRLDFKLARAVLEKSYENIFKECFYEESRLF